MILLLLRRLSFRGGAVPGGARRGRCWQGNGRQIEFVQQLVEDGTITSTYLGHLFSALEPEWRSALGWSFIDLPLKEARQLLGELSGQIAESRYGAVPLGGRRKVVSCGHG